VPLGRKSLYGSSLLSSEIGTEASYKPVGGGGMRVSRLSSCQLVKVEGEYPYFQFEAVLGKTRRTEF
jgi:hypothetical protein